MFEGDPVPADALETGNFDVWAWIDKRGPKFAEPIAKKVIAALKESGVTKFGTVGFCFGARIGFNLAFEGVSSVTVATHPSHLEVPADLEVRVFTGCGDQTSTDFTSTLQKYATTNAPLLINSCTVDQMFPLDAQAKADEILGGGKFAPGYVREYWDGCVHGFAVRGDMVCVTSQASSCP